MSKDVRAVVATMFLGEGEAPAAGGDSLLDFDRPHFGLNVAARSEVALWAIPAVDVTLVVDADPAKAAARVMLSAPKTGRGVAVPVLFVVDYGQHDF